jgi:ABC-type lipoprotein export system ATPase subunit
MIMVTHSIEAANVADRILYLREGKLSDSHAST